MPRITFANDFVWKVKPNVRLVYKAGKTYPITTKCLKDAEMAGAVSVKKPRLRLEDAGG